MEEQNDAMLDLQLQYLTLQYVVSALMEAAPDRDRLAKMIELQRQAFLAETAELPIDDRAIAFVEKNLRDAASELQRTRV